MLNSETEPHIAICNICNERVELKEGYAREHMKKHYWDFRIVPKSCEPFN